MKRIGILGGTFNPPHAGHLIVANEVLHALSLDEVRLMPASIPPHKAKPQDATPAQRLHMAALATEGADRISVSPFEVERGGISYTYDTMEAMVKAEPDSEFHFIIGGDMIDMLPKWHRIDELMRLVNFVGVQRPGTLAETDYPIRMVGIPQIDLSSTLVRERIRAGGTVTFLIPESVETFIREEGLYVE